jgi:hypothetical protein
MLLPTGMADLLGSGRPCRRNSLCGQCLKIAGLGTFGRAHPCFLSDRLVSEGTLRSSAGCQYHGAYFPFMVLAEKIMKAEIGGIAMMIASWW